MDTRLFDRVMVAFGAEPADAALLQAAHSLQPAPTELHVVTVREESTHPAESVVEQVEHLDRLVRSTPWRSPGPQITCAVLSGPTLDALLGYAREQQIDLLVVGHRDGHGHGLARRLARQAPCAVWMVPEGVPQARGKVVVPTDFSPTAGRALDTALAWCRAGLATSCLMVNVVTHAGDARTAAREVAEDALRAYAGHDTGGVEVSFAVEDAPDVATGIARVVERTGATLVCMGARGRTRAAAVLLGSATEDVLAGLACPVLVVRSGTAPLTLFQVLAQRVFSEQDRPRSVA